jgi:hypothetical protein
MKIDAVLARHPWPWRDVYIVKNEEWVIYDDNNRLVLIVCGTSEEQQGPMFLDLVAAHVARSQAQATHSEECWRWHHGCAVAMVRRGESEMAELLAAAGDILLSFTAGTECRIPHHQVERLFKAVHGKDAKTPWDDDEEDKQ